MDQSENLVDISGPSNSGDYKESNKYEIKDFT